MVPVSPDGDAVEHVLAIGGAARVRAVRVTPALLALVLAGCMTGNFVGREALPEPISAGDAPGSVAPAEKKADGDKPDEPPKETAAPPRPRTLPQAVCTYLRSFHEPLPEPKKEGADSPERGKKNPSTSEKKDGGNSPPDKPWKEGDKQDGSQGKKNPEGIRDKDKTKDKDEGGKDKEKNDKESDEKKEEKEDKGPDEGWYSAHGQFTFVTARHDAIRALYTGPNSLLPTPEQDSSITATLFLDFRLWEDGHNSGEVVFNPEVAGGSGFSNVMGIAGFPNGEITRVGVVEPTVFIARLFYRQTWGFGGEQEKVKDEPGENQIAGARDIDRITLTIGKFTYTDVMDDNAVSHDPRSRFLNWGLMYNGAWDYPANVRGYSYGLAVDFNQKDWALRYGVMAEPAIANGAPIDPRFLEANGQTLEWEGRYGLDACPGHLRLLGYLNRADMGNYGEALQEMPVDPVVSNTRAYRFKYGCGLSWDQEVTKDLGVFSRLGWDDGHSETWAFTEIDRTASLGLVLKGREWRRPDDVLGIAGLINGLSKAHREYLEAGGLGFIIGDGQLNYAPEQIVEVFYNYQISKGIVAAADFQEIVNPAYNRDRGPVNVWSLRIHMEF